MGDRAEFVLGISQQEVLLQVSAFVVRCAGAGEHLSLSFSLCFVFSSSRSFDEEALSFICFCSLCIATDPSNVLSHQPGVFSQPPRLARRESVPVGNAERAERRLTKKSAHMPAQSDVTGAKHDARKRVGRADDLRAHPRRRRRRTRRRTRTRTRQRKRSEEE